MKTNLIRALAIAMLATSMSAFAVTNDSKAVDAVSPCTNQSQAGDMQNTKDSRRDKKSKQQKKHNDQKENSDEFSGIWG